MRRLLAAALFALVVTPVAADADRGLAFVRTHCAACHAVTGTGSSPNQRAPTFLDVSRRYPPEQLAEALAEGIMVGHEGEMPEFRLRPRDVTDVIAHLRRLRDGRS